MGKKVRKGRTAGRKAEVFSSVELENKRVYFRMRSNARIKRARLVVSPEEGLVVESPREPNVHHAHRLIQRRKTWVISALDSVRLKQQRAFEIKQHANSILVFGREKVLYVRFGQKRDYLLENRDSIYLGFQKARVQKSDIESRLADWLREKAERYLPLRVRQINQGRFDIKGVYVKDQRTIWGSCSAEGNINLNWRLIMAPRAFSDYIILHELCHTKHLNHSKRYWTLVEEVCPTYETAENWFKTYGFLLHVNLFGWI